MYYYVKTIIFTLLLCGVKIINSQEWQWMSECDEQNTEYYSPIGFLELSNGNLLAPAIYLSRGSSQEYYYSESPGVMLFSDDGNLITQKNFFRPGYCISHSAQYIFEKENNFYLLTTYSPEHTPGSYNHFKNYDNPPSDANLSLLKLDDQLNVEEVYDNSWTIDTYEAQNELEWQLLPNAYSGNIFLFSAFEDDGDIIGAYWKCESYKSLFQGDDTLFFFRMNFNGEIINKKCIGTVGPSKNDNRGGAPLFYRTNHFVVTDSCYIFYDSGNGNSNDYYVQGTARYFDKDFNFLRERYLKGPNCLINDMLYNITVKRSDHNTTYLTTQKRNPDNPHHDENCRLYEINDDINATSNYLEVVHYNDRGTDEWDMSSYRYGVDIKDDNSIYYTYTLNQGYYTNLDSWIVIECLDNNLDTISTMYYGVNNDVLDRVITLKSTKDGGVIIIHDADKLYSDNGACIITKFPASAFVNIEEAHAHGLHLAVAYPNPGGDVMNIRTGLRNAVLTVYDINGRKIHEQEITDDVTSIDASNWQSGTYIWKLGMRNEELGMKEVETGKWVK